MLFSRFHRSICCMQQWFHTFSYAASFLFHFDHFLKLDMLKWYTYEYQEEKFGPLYQKFSFLWFPLPVNHPATLQVHPVASCVGPNLPAKKPLVFVVSGNDESMAAWTDPNPPCWTHNLLLQSSQNAPCQQNTTWLDRSADSQRKYPRPLLKAHSEIKIQKHK